MPRTIHGLPVVDACRAEYLGCKSITTDIHSVHEAAILAGVCQHRDPSRACLICSGNGAYQLAILKQDIREVSPDN